MGLVVSRKVPRGGIEPPQRSGSAYRDKYTDAAILTAILFAGGLAAGRCVSLIADGRPAFMLLTYLAAEIGVVLIGYWVFASRAMTDRL